MPTVGEIVKSARNRADWSQEELAARAKVSRATIQNTELGVRNPSQGTLSRIARAFDCTTWEEFLHRHAGLASRSARISDPANGIPILADVPAGNGDNEPMFDGAIAEDYISRHATGVDDPRAYALRVKGQSMTPELQDGELILCSPTAWEERGLEDGKIYAIRLSAELDNEATVKRVQVVSDDQVSLVPENPRYERRIVKVEYIVHAAKVVGAIRKYD